MADGVVSRLHLRLPQGHLGPTRARIEDALSRAGTDERLLLLRRLDFGRMPVGGSAAYWGRAAASRVAEARARAVHGASPGAERAEAVWFHSSEEAWMLLLRALASGSACAAWFWRLAVQGWNGAPLNVWLPGVLRQAERNPEMLVRTARAVAPLIEARMWAPALAALASMPRPKFPPMLPPRIVPLKGEAPRLVATDASGIVPATMLRLMERLSPAARASIAAAMRSASANSAVRAWLVRLVLAARMPELAAAPLLLAEAGDVLAELLLAARPPIDRGPVDADGASISARSADAWPPRDPVPPAKDAEGPANEARNPNEPVVRDSRNGEHDAAEPVRTSPPDPDVPLAEIAVERVSEVAGLFLTIAALQCLGLPGWLDRHPKLAYEGFARRLLIAIAARMGAGPHDPVWRALMRDDTTGADIAASDPPELETWRIGLDRWLRRTARISLSETVRRRGWIIADAERISVRFRLDDADIRLRRRALDVDPGWVPWLGLLVRYVYRDEPRT